MKIKIIDINGETGFIIPNEFHEKLGLKAGNTEIGLIEKPYSFELIPYTPISEPECVSENE
jgi:hypothetical protein